MNQTKRSKISTANEIIRLINCAPQDVVKIARLYNVRVRVCADPLNRLSYKELFKQVKQINHNRELPAWMQRF